MALLFGSQSEKGSSQTVLLSKEPTFGEDGENKGQMRRESTREEEVRWHEVGVLCKKSVVVGGYRG